jgi:hypothetical protein
LAAVWVQTFCGLKTSFIRKNQFRYQFLGLFLSLNKMTVTAK